MYNAENVSAPRVPCNIRTSGRSMTESSRDEDIVREVLTGGSRVMRVAS
jgi:hypothetical protein